MAGRKGNLEAVRRGVGQPLNAVGPEVVILALLAVRDHRGAARLEARDGVPDGTVVKRVQLRIRPAPRGDRLDQLDGSRDAADGLGRDRHPKSSLPLCRGTGCGVASGGSPLRADVKGDSEREPRPIIVQGRFGKAGSPAAMPERYGVWAAFPDRRSARRITDSVSRSPRRGQGRRLPSGRPAKIDKK